MMAINSTSSMSLGLKDRVTFKLITLFIGTFLAVFVGSWVANAFTSLLENRGIESELQNQPELIVIDPKIQSNLAKVMAFDAIPTSAEIKDPFNDSSGISNNGTPTTAGNTRPTTQPAAKTTTSVTTPARSPKTTSNPQVAKTNNGSGGSTTDAKNVVVEDTLTRILKRDERIRAGLDAGTESTVFAIDDLLPVGVVSGGDGADEIMFYSQSADRTFSYPVGTQFYDGWLTEIKSEGAVFSFNDQNRTMKLKSWARSIKSKSGGAIAGGMTSQD